MKFYIASLFGAVAVADELAKAMGELDKALADLDKTMAGLANMAENLADSQLQTMSLTFPDQKGGFAAGYAQLSQTKEPYAPVNNVQVFGLIMNGPDGAKTLTTEVRGNWSLDWRNASGSSTFDVYWGGVAFGMTRDVTTETTNADGTTTSTTTTLTNMWTWGGMKDASDDKTKVTGKFLKGTGKAITNNKKMPTTWNIKGTDIAGDADSSWTVVPPVADFKSPEVIFGGNKYLTGLEVAATRPLTVEGAKFNIENLTEYDMWGAVWVLDTKKNVNVMWQSGSTKTKIDMPVPKPVEPTPVTPIESGATNVIASAFAAALLLNMTF